MSREDNSRREHRIWPLACAESQHPPRAEMRDLETSCFGLPRTVISCGLGSIAGTGIAISIDLHRESKLIHQVPLLMIHLCTLRMVVPKLEYHHHAQDARS